MGQWPRYLIRKCQSAGGYPWCGRCRCYPQNPGYRQLHPSPLRYVETIQVGEQVNAMFLVGQKVDIAAQIVGNLPVTRSPLSRPGWVPRGAKISIPSWLRRPASRLAPQKLLICLLLRPSTGTGVRPLVDDGSGKPETASRGYHFDLDTDASGTAPLLSIFGGKITTYRHLAESAIGRLAEHLPMLAGPSWTLAKPLPGGDFPMEGAEALR